MSTEVTRTYVNTPSIRHNFDLGKNALGKRVKKNFEFSKKTYFRKHLLINVQQNILLRTLEWFRDATNALEQDDSLLNKGLNKFFLNYNSCDLFSIQDSFSYVCSWTDPDYSK